MKVSILDAQHTIFEGVVSMATLPASGGELSIMDDHEPIFVALTNGRIRLEPIAKGVRLGFAKSQEPQSIEGKRSFAIRQGVARMKNNELVILVE